MLAVTVAPFFGQTFELTFGEIFWRIRLPRVFLGFLAGAGLGVAGLVFQALFRNSLASPYTLGVASGASFGAALGIQIGLGLELLGINVSTLGALLGACASILLIYSISARLQTASSVGILLAGVVISFFFGSLLLFVQFFSDFTQSFLILRWLMGGLDILDSSRLLLLGPVVALSIIFASSRAAELDAIASGEDFAIGVGVDVSKWRNLLFISMSLMVAVVVSLVGPIAFVGIMIPHICRNTLGPAHFPLVYATALSSGAFLVSCDTIARTILAPADIPVGIITALLGAPFFLSILLSKKGTLVLSH